MLLEECGGTLLPGGRKLRECLDYALSVGDEWLGGVPCLLHESSLPGLVGVVADGASLLEPAFVLLM